MLSFPRALSRELRPLVRLLEDPFFAEGTSGTPSALFRPSSSFTHFTPSFDVKETADNYVLEGELPGVIDKKELDLHFVDPQTLVIKGRIERASESGEPEGQTQVQNTGEVTAKRPEQPTTEGEETTGNGDGNKYWIKERMVGEFQRSFSFPKTIDQEAVKASLNHGILSVTVPKKHITPGARRIQIE